MNAYLFLDTTKINKNKKWKVDESMDFTVRRMMFKIVHTSSLQTIRDCQTFFKFLDVTVSVEQGKHKFLNRYASSEN
jgi:hypothetical protein